MADDWGNQDAWGDTPIRTDPVEDDPLSKDKLALQRGSSTGSGWGDEAADAGAGAADDWGDEETGDTMVMVDKLPKELVERVTDDVDELRMIGRFSAADPNFGGGTRICLRFAFPVENIGLDEEQAKAWNVDPKKLFVLELRTPPHYFNLTQLSQLLIEFGQANSMKDRIEGFALSWTIENRIKSQFLANLPNKVIDSDYKPKDAKEVMEVAGVNYIEAINALRSTKFNVHGAIDKVVSEAKSKLARQPSQVEKEEKKDAQEEEPEVDVAVYSEDVQALIKKFKTNARVAELALDINENKLDAATAFLNTKANLKQLQEILRVDDPPVLKRTKTNNTQTSLQVKVVERELAKHNYLVRLMLFVEETVKTCHQYCTICGSKLQYYGLKPAVCNRDLCKMGIEDLGLTFDLGSLIQQHPKVCDLLISVAMAAIEHKRMNFVAPINVNVILKNGEELSFVKKGSEEKDKEKELDYDRLKKCLEQCPSIAEMIELHKKGTLDEQLKKLDPLLMPLLRWIMVSNRAHLRELTPSEHVHELNTPHQFVLLSSPPEKEAKFQNLKKYTETVKGKDKGSIYAFHGSAIGNWHSILRTGLKNMSNTKFMANGAAYGAGIYMATESGTSLGYSATKGGWAKSQFGHHIQLLAICEVINDPNLKPPNPYYVVPNELIITTRFVCVYSQSSCQISAAALQPKLPKLGGKVSSS